MENNQASQYVIFKLEEQFGIDIQKVQTIERMKPIVRVPRTGEVIQGIINLRGEIVPVINLRKFMGLSEVEADKNTRIVILNAADGLVGIIVDRVNQVMDITTQQINGVDNMDLLVETHYMQGIVMDEQEEVITLLKIEDIADKAFEKTKKIKS